MNRPACLRVRNQASVSKGAERRFAVCVLILFPVQGEPLRVLSMGVMDIVIFEGIVRFKGNPILLGDTASPRCGQQAGLFTYVAHPRTVPAQEGHTTTSSHLTRRPGASPGGEAAVITSLWGWPLEGTTQRDLLLTHLLPTSMAAGRLHGREMNASPPPAGPLSERVCCLIRGQACCSGLALPTSWMSNWDSRGDREVATMPLLFCGWKAPERWVCTMPTLFAQSRQSRRALCGKLGRQVQFGPNGTAPSEPACPLHRWDTPPLATSNQNLLAFVPTPSLSRWVP